MQLRLAPRARYALGALCLLTALPAAAVAQQPDEIAPEEPEEILEERRSEQELLEQGLAPDERAELLVETEQEEEEVFVEFAAVDLWSKLALEFELIGPNERDRRDVAGTAHTLSKRQIERLAPRSTSELLDFLPNVTVADVDAMGLRLNLGMRGFPPGQSTYALVLEDGIPIAAAPYLDGAILYTTPVEQIERVELLTGSSSVLHGPQNMGGAINLVTHAPPRSFTTAGYLQGGSFGRLNLGASVGDTKGVVGYLLEAHHRRFEGPRQLDLQSTSLSAKFRLQPSQRSWFGAKLSIYDEFSRASATGLTPSILERDASIVVAPYDRNELDRLAASIQHTYLVGAVGTLQTSLWTNAMSRHVQQQRFERQPRSIQGYEREILGESATRGSLYFFNATDITEERFNTYGGESRLTLDADFGRLARAEVITGLRLTREEIDRDLKRGDHGGSPSGTSLLEEERQGDSLAGYALTRVFLAEERLRLEPGVRLEYLRSERRVWRDTLDGEAIDLNPPRDGADTTTSLLPGVGASFDLGKHVTLFSSAYRSMAIPEERLASALIDPQVNLSPEYAWNFELGTRLYDRNRVQLDLAGFYIATQNLTLPLTTLNSTALTFEAGETRHLGAEASLSADPARYFRTILRFPMSLSYAYTRARLTDGFGSLYRGNLVPHVPQHEASAQLGAEHPLGFAAQLTGRYTGERFAEIENLVPVTPDGVRGLIEARTTIDARFAYLYSPWNVTFYMLGKNLLDERAVHTRTSQGVQAFGDREFIAGARAEF